jgi:hypothetical protein
MFAEMNYKKEGERGGGRRRKKKKEKRKRRGGRGSVVSCPSVAKCVIDNN